MLIDEAHAFRNADNTWYAALDRLLGGTKKDVVLLTATPVNNSLWDLHNMVLLFARHDAAFRHSGPEAPVAARDLPGGGRARPRSDPRGGPVPDRRCVGGSARPALHPGALRW